MTSYGNSLLLLGGYYLIPMSGTVSLPYTSFGINMRMLLFACIGVLLFLYHLRYGYAYAIVRMHSRVLILIPFFGMGMRTSPLLGGYGARTRGVY